MPNFPKLNLAKRVYLLMIIYLEKNETLYSALQKISQAKGKTVELVIPEYATLGKNSMNMKLLSAEAKKSKKELTIVTKDKVLTNLAAKSKLSVKTKPSQKSQEPELEEITTPEALAVTESQKGEDALLDEDDIVVNDESQKLADPIPVKNDSLTVLDLKNDVGAESLDDEDEIIEEEKDQNEVKSLEQEDEDEVEELGDGLGDKALKLDLPKNTKKGRSLGKVFAIFMGVILLFIVGLVAGAYYLLPKANVEIILAGKELQADSNIKVVTGAVDVNVEDRVIPGTVLTLEETGEKTATTTGKKTVGTKATGTITIQNFTNTQIIFPGGTAVTVSEGGSQQFVTDAGVTVAAGKEVISDDEEGNPQKIVTPGVANVQVTAVDFGSDYNVAAKTKFTVGTEAYSDFRATNDAAMSGGSSKEVSVVAQSDQSNLFDQLKSELEQKAKKDFESKLVGDQKLVEKTMTFNVLSQTFDQNIDSETETLGLSLKLESRVIYYSDSQLKLLGKSVLQNQVPEGYILKDTNLLFSSEVTSSEVNGDTTMKTQIKTTVYPVLLETDIKEALKGKTPSEAEAYLKGMDKVLGYTLSVWPPYPASIQRMPFMDNRIEVVTKVQEVK